MRWTFSLRSLFLVMLAVAIFCCGWVCKEQWDRTPFLTPSMSPNKVESLVEVLTDLHERHLQQVTKTQTQLEAAEDDVTRSFCQQQIEMGMHVADELSTRIERLERERHRLFVSRWFSASFVHCSLLLSAWVMSCIVAMRIGVFSTQVGSRSQGPPVSRSERRL